MPNLIEITAAQSFGWQGLAETLAASDIESVLVEMPPRLRLAVDASSVREIAHALETHSSPPANAVKFKFSGILRRHRHHLNDVLSPCVIRVSASLDHGDPCKRAISASAAYGSSCHQDAHVGHIGGFKAGSAQPVCEPYGMSPRLPTTWRRIFESRSRTTYWTGRLSTLAIDRPHVGWFPLRRLRDGEGAAAGDGGP